jgi:hypothetical protein
LVSMNFVSGVNFVTRNVVMKSTVHGTCKKNGKRLARERGRMKEEEEKKEKPLMIKTELQLWNFFSSAPITKKIDMFAPS